QVKPEFEKSANLVCGLFTLIIYRTQVVAGVNYFMKVQTSENEYVHLRVFKGLPHANEGPSLVRFQTGKTRDDPLDYF
ncbi:CYTA protein, partial [Turnix velox]|nr:CYTA protein [Turnix velox]